MKKIRTFNWLNNGNQSHLNIYFEDGTQWCRTISYEDVCRVITEKENCFEDLMLKYQKPQPKPEYQKIYGRKIFF